MGFDKITNDYFENSKVYTVCYRFKEMLKIEQNSLLSLHIYNEHCEPFYSTYHSLLL